MFYALNSESRLFTINSLVEAGTGKHVHKVLFIKMIKMLLPTVAYGSVHNSSSSTCVFPMKSVLYHECSEYLLPAMAYIVCGRWGKAL